MTPAVTVVVPTFQRRDYVLRAVNSVLAQTFEEFELIVVDDGSTDGTEEAVVGLDPRLRYEWQENQGTGAARNTGVRLARGAVVAFLDSDNRWRPNHLSIVSQALEHFPEAVLVSTCYRMHVAGRQKPCEGRLIEFLPLAYSDTWVGLTSCMAVRRAELDAVGGFNEELEALEDVELWLRLAERGPFAFVQHRTLIRQFTRESRTARAIRSGAMLEAFEEISKTGLEVARTTRRPDREGMIGRATGRAWYSRALRALSEGDEERFATSLDSATRLLPELSNQPEVVAWRIGAIARDEATRTRCLTMAANRWPDVRSDTALFLRARATFLALRVGRLRTAAALLRAWPMRQTSSFVVRNVPLWIRLGRQAIRERRRADESPALLALLGD